MNTLTTVLIALIVIVALLLVLIIMVQNPKGGGLSSTFGGGGGGFSIGGVQSTNTFLDKSTWTLAAVMVGLIILTNILLTSGHNTTIKDTRLKNEVENTLQTPPAPAEQAPAESTPAPVEKPGE